MTHYHCTVEFRDAKGRIRQHVTDLDAPDGDNAALQAEQEVLKSRRASGTTPTVTIEQIVCWRGDHP
ncbi:MAG: hypothetical protein WED00_10685 [Aquisalimonadaceae bacterium]